MPQLIAHVLTEGGVDADALAEQLRSAMSGLPEAQLVRVVVERPKIGLVEILAIVQVIEGVPIVLDFLGRLQGKHRGEIHGVEVESRGSRVPIEDLTPEQRKALEAPAGDPP